MATTLKLVRSVYFILLFFNAIPLSAQQISPTAISEVRTSKASFNPSLGQTVDFFLNVHSEGIVDVSILDSEGHIARILWSKREVATGPTTISWDGKNEEGEIVPDEAWSIKIDFTNKQGKTFSYFPANEVVRQYSVNIDYYDRQNAIIKYELPRTARIFVEAGTSKLDPNTKTVKRDVLHTIAAWQPRSAGAIVETWNGYGPNEQKYIPELPDFFISIQAMNLPENSVISYGNKSTTFEQYLASRGAGKSLFTKTTTNQIHSKKINR